MQVLSQSELGALGVKSLEKIAVGASKVLLEAARVVLSELAIGAPVGESFLDLLAVKR